jgi:hypothetical protein
MQAQREIQISAAPLPAALVLLATLALGSLGGYAVGDAGARSAAVTPSARVIPARPVEPAPQQTPATDLLGAIRGQTYRADEGQICQYGPSMECLSP